MLEVRALDLTIMKRVLYRRALNEKINFPPGFADPFLVNFSQNFETFVLKTY